MNVLTGLMEQTVEEVADKVAAYHARLVARGRDPEQREVTLMAHTFIGADHRRGARGRARPTGGLPACAHRAVLETGPQRRSEVDLDRVTEADKQTLADMAFDRYFSTHGLFGSARDCSGDCRAIPRGRRDRGRVPGRFRGGTRPGADRVSPSRRVASDVRCTLSRMIATSAATMMCLHQLIEAHAEGDPTPSPSMPGDRYLTYRELDSAANHLAGRVGGFGPGPHSWWRCTVGCVPSSWLRCWQYSRRGRPVCPWTLANPSSGHVRCCPARSRRFCFLPRSGRRRPVTWVFPWSSWAPMR